MLNPLYNGKWNFASPYLHSFMSHGISYVSVLAHFSPCSQVFDGHGGEDAAHYVRDNLPRVIVEDADFPLELEKVVKRSFMQTDSKFAETCSNNKELSSGTTALTAMIFGRYPVTSNSLLLWSC
jgi:hypothetical protein